ncbi:MAG: type II toxin-antitoxin system RelE/ParE family toxin [Smithellaceae bacterium]|jgi:plasmid stabilization system protein ParE|nr:type II toxin-antitoxin system RelE/ParE family toxin [Smithellaceae bacterium]
MPQKKPITFAISAFDDLETIRAWYQDQQVPEVGGQLTEEILAQIERLADFPESGRVVPEFGIANLREIIYPPFRIVYRLDGNKVKIVRIWRSERLLTMPL